MTCSPDYLTDISVNGDTGDLSFDTDPNRFGVLTCGVQLWDDGGTANGGVDHSAVQTFTITIDNVNDPPSYEVGSDESVLEDSGSHTYTGWATQISPGPYETEAVTFHVDSNSLPAGFSSLSVNPSGDLSFTLASNQIGTANIELYLYDGSLSSGDQEFTITIIAVNHVPSFNVPAVVHINENSGWNNVCPFATSLSPGGQFQHRYFAICVCVCVFVILMHPHPLQYLQMKTGKL